jgi:hypothetical protein
MNQNVDSGITVGQNDGPKTANRTVDWFDLTVKQMRY